MSATNERQQLEEDIERIKSALESTASDWQFAVDVSESEDEDALKISCPEWKSDEEAEGGDITNSVIQGAAEQDDQLKKQNQLIEVGMALNKAYQEIVIENLETIRVLLAENREQQEDVERTISEDLAGKSGAGKSKKRRLKFYGYPFFRDKDGVMPPMNYDTRIKRTGEEIEAYLRPGKSWKPREKEKLKKAVQQDLMRQKLRPLLNRKELEMEKLAEADNENGDEQKEAILKRIEKLEKDINEIKNTPLQFPDDVDSYVNTIDWMKISNIDFDGVRKPDECFVYWRNHLQPNVNSGAWTPDEDKKLTKLAKKYDGRNWEKIAQSLGTKRSAFQCLQRYQTKLNPSLQAGKWTQEEDIFLKEVVASLQIGDTIPWNQVAYYMENRSNEQCEFRWEQIQKSYGRWTKKEDKLLVMAVNSFGKQWSKVQEMVPNRSAQQCRERYTNTLAPELKVGFWRYHEDKLLWQQCQGQTTLKWAQIAQSIPGRSDNSCLQRYRLLVRLKHVEDILLKMPDGKATVDKLLRKKPRPKCNKKHSTHSRETKIRLMKNKIREREKIVADAQKKIDLLNIITSKRTERSIRYYEEKMKNVNEEIREIREELTKCEKRMANATAPTPLQYRQILADIAEAVRDREKGVYVPRPLLGMVGLRKMLFSLESQLRLKNVLQARTARRLKLLPDHTDIDQDPDTTSKPKSKSHSSQGRRKSSVEEVKVTQEIFNLVHDHNRKKFAGRPRNFRRRPPGEPEERARMLMEHEVFKIFVNALNFDVNGAKLLATKHWATVNRESDDLQMKNLHADLELFQRALNISAESQPSKDGEQESPQKTPSSVSLQILPRRALQGQPAKKAYSLPPLPPTVSTLMGFKTLLLRRRQLVERANTKLIIPPDKSASRSRDSTTRTAKKQKLNDGTAVPTSVGAADGVGVRDLCAKGQASLVPIGSQLTEFQPATNRNDGAQGSAAQNTKQMPHFTDGCSAVGQPAPEVGKQSGSPGRNCPLQEVQPRVMILKANQLDPATLTKMLREKGIELDMGRVKVQVCKKSKIARSVMAKSSKVTQSMGSRVQTKHMRRKALPLLQQTHDFQLLKARFRSLFLWPALLSTIAVQPEDDGSSVQREGRPGQSQGRADSTQGRETSRRGREQNESQNSSCESDEMDEERAGSSTSRPMEEDGKDDVDELEKELNDDESLVIPAEFLKRRPEKHEQAVKKTKKHLTKQNRYPCSGGKRFRKRLLQRCYIKRQQLEKFRNARQRVLAKQKEKELLSESDPDKSNVDNADDSLQGAAQQSPGRHKNSEAASVEEKMTSLEERNCSKMDIGASSDPDEDIQDQCGLEGGDGEGAEHMEETSEK